MPPVARIFQPLHLILVVIALFALAVPMLVVLNPPRLPPPVKVARPVRVVPPAELPKVEPVAYQALDPADARAWNAAIPFASGPNPAARPFRFAGTDAASDRARDCLAAAMLYEAGDDPVGERAVGQVVINRVRHPAFPKTICGVVFQGSERSTGCQFTFTCDGAITRMPGAAAWERARLLATRALSGSVYAPVGHSTHYHTDWVVPYWSASLDKVAAVHTHLFFRWTGWWGTPPAFRRTVSGDEPAVPQLALLSEAHRSGAVLAEAGAALIEGQAALAGSTPQALADPNTFLVTIDKRADPALLPAIAQRTCGTRDYCKFMAWTDRALTPTAPPPSPAQVSAMAFSYLRDRLRNYDKPLWNCAIWKRSEPSQCMKVQFAPVREPLAIGDMFSSKALPTATVVPAGPAPLTGIRRVTPAPTPTPSATPVSR